jgi:hypothetical protein
VDRMLCEMLHIDAVAYQASPGLCFALLLRRRSAETMTRSDFSIQRRSLSSVASLEWSVNCENSSVQW